MGEQINIELSTEAKALLASLDQAPQKMLEAIAATLKYQNELTVSHIQSSYLSFPKDGPPSEIGLRVQSNRLRQSAWASDPVISGQVVDSAIGDNVEYAAAHEFGADIPAHKVVAKGKALRFQIGDRVLYRKSVNIPEVHLPARGMFRRGINDRLSEYSKSISIAMVEAMKP
jgi:phage gpG-like protein